MWAAYCRQLFNLMERIGLWRHSQDGTDSLHMALMREWGKEHLGELGRDELVGFTNKARDAAREKLTGVPA